MLVAVTAAKGAPGVTTTAWALASVWPRDVVLADCDPAGGDLALLGRTEDQGVLDPDRGLLSLAADARRHLAADALGEHLQVLAGGLEVLCGVAGPEQVTGMGQVWPAVATHFASLTDRDVVADCGRLTPGSPALPLVTGADVVLVVVRPRLESYAHLRSRLRWLADATTHRAPTVGVVVVSADAGAPRELAELLAYSGIRARVLGPLAEDHRAADALAGRTQRGLSRSLLIRSARELAAEAHGLGGGLSGLREGGA